MSNILPPRVSSVALIISFRGEDSLLDRNWGNWYASIHEHRQATDLTDNKGQDLSRSSQAGLEKCLLTKVPF